MSRETTFETDLHAVRDKDELGKVFTRLCQQVAADLKRKGYDGKTIGIKLRYDNFKSVTRDQTLTFYTQDATDIRKFAGLCLKRVDLSRKLRLLGVRVGSLVKHGSGNPSHGPMDTPTPSSVQENSVEGQRTLLFTEEPLSNHSGSVALIKQR
jgi:DNA polymerase-4